MNRKVEVNRVREFMREMSPEFFDRAERIRKVVDEFGKKLGVVINEVYKECNTEKEVNEFVHIILACLTSLNVNHLDALSKIVDEDTLLFAFLESINKAYSVRNHIPTDKEILNGMMN